MRTFEPSAQKVVQRPVVELFPYRLYDGFMVQTPVVYHCFAFFSISSMTISLKSVVCPQALIEAAGKGGQQVRGTPTVENAFDFECCKR